MRKNVGFLFLAFIFVVSCKHNESRSSSQFILSFETNSDMGELNAKLGDVEIKSGTFIANKTIVSLEANAKKDYCVDYWQINNEKKYKGKNIINVKIENHTIIFLYFRKKSKACKLTYSFNNEQGSLIVQKKENAAPLKSGIFINEGTKVFFKATSKDDFYISGWTLNGNPINDLNSTYELEIKEDSHIKISFSKEIKKIIQTEKVIIGKTKYLKEATSDEKALSLLENGNEEILISENKIDVAIHIEKPKEIKVELVINNEQPEDLQGDSGIFEKKNITINENFKIVKIILSHKNYVEKNYTFKIKRKEIVEPSIPENLRIKALFADCRLPKPRTPIMPSNNGRDYNLEFPADLAGHGIYLWVLAENEEAKFREKGILEIYAYKADGKKEGILSPIPPKNQTNTFVIVISHDGKEFEYNLNVSTKDE